MPARSKARRASPAHAAAVALEEAAVLDPVGDPLTAAVRRALPAGPLKDALSGTWLGHALHPLLTDVTLGALVSSVVLDLAGGRRSGPAADRLIWLGILSALPTAASGAADWGDTKPGERRVGLVHAAANTVGLGLFCASLAARRRGRRAKGVALSLAGAGVLGVGGYLGGHLTYALGLGVDRTAFDSRPEEWTDAVSAQAVWEGRLTHAVVGCVELVLTRHDGGIVALSNLCTHRGAPLHEGRICDGAIVCPWHQSVFRLADGGIEQGPATTPAPRWEARVRAGRVEVRAA
jgi:nitrite reductase/ring-hydroxylating ferredoxin subunit/uncharacterized membrane protein